MSANLRPWLNSTFHTEQNPTFPTLVQFGPCIRSKKQAKHVKFKLLKQAKHKCSTPISDTWFFYCYSRILDWQAQGPTNEFIYRRNKTNLLQHQYKSILQVVASQSTASFIIHRPHTSGTLRPVVEPGNDFLQHCLKGNFLLFIKEESPVQMPSLVVAVRAILWLLWIFTARCALPQASLKRWTTLPKATAVWRGVTYGDLVAGSWSYIISD